mmetsp:Transcript_5358/g.13038  ORF Transcript_5358/g.13038 Transcript_5358/m.13038 type:complete len:393 (-) Transcript_5358:102-1280(-)
MRKCIHVDRRAPQSPMRRPEVTTADGSIRTRPRRPSPGPSLCIRMQRSASSMMMSSGLNPPTARKRSARQNIAWSPKRRRSPRQKDSGRNSSGAYHVDAALCRLLNQSTRSESWMMGKKPPSTTPGCDSAPRACSTRFRGGSVSAWRKHRMSPRAAAAPAFICAPLPRGPLTTFTPCRFASGTVLSVLPPSTTIISKGDGESSLRYLSVCSIILLSFSTGTMMETETVVLSLANVSALRNNVHPASINAKNWLCHPAGRPGSSPSAAQVFGTSFPPPPPPLGLPTSPYTKVLHAMTLLREIKRFLPQMFILKLDPGRPKAESFFHVADRGGFREVKRLEWADQFLDIKKLSKFMSVFTRRRKNFPSSRLFKSELGLSGLRKRRFHRTQRRTS